MVKVFNYPLHTQQTTVLCPWGQDIGCFVSSKSDHHSALHYWPFVRGTTGPSGFPTQRASNEESISRPYHHHVEYYVMLDKWKPNVHKHKLFSCTLVQDPARPLTHLRHGQNGRHFADGVFKWIFIKEKSCILFQISLKFVPKGPIDKKSALVQVTAWCRTGGKPLPELMLTQFANAYMRH